MSVATLFARRAARDPTVAVLLAGVALAGTGAAADWSATISRDPVAPAAPGAHLGMVTVCADDGLFTGGVTVTTAAGAPVGALVLWAAPGEPTTVLFDASSDAPGYIITPGGDSHWSPNSGVTVECRTRVDGPCDTWDQAKALWARGAVQGRAVVANVFQACDPCGPTRDYGADYSGWFTVPQAGRYRFATLSDDASFIAIDDKVLVEWGGWHGLGGGERGEHGAEIDLQAGPHRLEYLYFQNGDNPIVEVAWTPPGAHQPAVMPADAFGAVTHYRVDAERTGGADAPWIAWENASHLAIDDKEVDEVAVTAHLPAGAPAPHWTFDDGGAADGVSVHHRFARPGARTVRLTSGGITLARTIAVHRVWTQLEDWSDQAYGAARDDFNGRLGAIDAADLLALVRLALAQQDLGWLGTLAGPALEKPDRWGADGGEVLGELGMRLQDPALRRYDDAERLWRAALALIPGHPQLREHIALHLGGLLIHGLGRANDARAVLEAIVPDALDGTEKRLLLLYQGDALLAAGEVEAARARYDQAGNVVAPADIGYAVRRRTRLEAARDWLARNENEQALQTIGEIEWETPGERLGTETGLLAVRAHLARKEYGFALSRCQMMLNAVGPDEHRADVLLALVRTSLAAGLKDQAMTAARTLIKDHPYSPAAAAVKDLLPAAATP
jgi:tetratricopeptide (TPR) repeat protein